MHALWTAAFHNPALRAIQDLLGPDDYLVGGCLRDLALGRPVADFDILTFGDAGAKADAIAARLGAHAFWMDKARGIARIAAAGTEIKIDICAPKAATITADLALRDITINALALSAATGELIDPLGGLADLQSGCIRAISEQSLIDDPLRVLRCLRFALLPGFSLEPQTSAWLQKHAPAVPNAAPERIHQELCAALANPGSAKLFRRMHATGLLNILFPEYQDMEQGIYHRWPLIEHILLAAEEIDILLDTPENYLPGIGAYFAEELEDGLTRAAALRLAAFLHDIGKPETCTVNEEEERLHFFGHARAGARITERTLERLRFATRSMRIISGIVEHHMRILELSLNGAITPRAMHRLLNATHEFIPELLLMVKADAHATGLDPGYLGAKPDIHAVALQIWRYYQDTYLQTCQAPLLNGRDVMQALGIPPSQEIGRLLALVEEARAEGIIATREEALAFIKAEKAED